MIKHLITRIYGYKVFAEIDLTNAFHQNRGGDFKKTFHTRIYSRMDLSAENTAECIIDSIIMYGLYTECHTDPGSGFMSEVMRMVTKYLDLKTYVVSLVDRHESNIYLLAKMIKTTTKQWSGTRSFPHKRIFHCC